MRVLKEIIVFTSDMEAMSAFYTGGLGLRAVHASPHGTSFETTGATLALHPLRDGGEREIGLTFESLALEDEVQRLRARGVEVGPIRRESFGSIVQLRDHEGNRLSFREGAGADDVAGSDAPAVATAIVNCRDLVAAVAFYRDRLGFKIAYEAPHWIELETGATRLALHTRPSGLNHPLHAAQKVAFCLETGDVDSWVDEMRARGLHFATAPIEEEFGLYAEIVDPDGNVVVFREPRPEPTVEEELAEAFESDEVPHVVAIRKPVLKSAKAVSRVALRPDYRESRASTRRAQFVEVRLPEPAVPSVRGAEPAGTRLKPKATRNSKRAKVKPAVGRGKKAVRKSQTRKKRATARTSKTKPVKRAAARKKTSRR